MNCEKQHGVPAGLIIVGLLVVGGAYHGLTQRIDWLEHKLILLENILREKRIIKYDE